MILSVNKIECHRINPNRVGSYIDSPDSTKKKTTKTQIASIKTIINAFNTLQQLH